MEWFRRPDGTGFSRRRVDKTHHLGGVTWLTAINPFLAPPEESVANFPNWFDPEAYGWALEAIRTDEFEERKALYSNIMVRINEQAPVWYTGGTPTLIAADENIRGVNNWTLPSGALGNGTPGAQTYFAEMFVSDS